jgi:hypothetical protein
MALELDGRQRSQMRDALLDGFPTWADLDMMVSDQLGENLAAIAPESAKLTTVAHELIKWAGARGKLGDVIVGARNANPDNPQLFRVAQRVGLTSTSEPKSTLEKVVGGNTTFLDVAAWRGALTRMEWKVCRIDRDGRGVGTGFLVGPDAVLTNYHVVESAIKGGTPHGRYSCRFDYKMSEAGDVIAAGEVVDLAPGDEAWLIASSPYSAVDTVPDPKPGDPGVDELDFALLRLSDNAGLAAASGSEMGEPRSWVDLSRDPVDFGTVSTLAILQHPDSAPLKLALGMEQTIAINGVGNRIRYTIPTLPGSSGSPVFDSEWTLLALHHSGDPSTIKPEYNEAIPIANIATQPAVAEYLQHLADED